MSYTVLARRYRSETFDDVIGQEAVVRTLKNAIQTDHVAHAYLFSGTRGVGKTSMARILAKALNCLKYDKPTITPCCQCESCLGINEGEFIDVLEIDGASNTGVEHIRELRQNAIYRPARARFKIYIIDEVHMLSVSAFNALLKTLEEPPEHVKFILATTEPNKVLPTILSRCQRFDFRNISIDDIVSHIKHILKEEKIAAEEALIRRVARLGRGSMRDALSLLDQLLSMNPDKLTLSLLEELLGTPRPERIIELAEAISRNDLAEALRQVDTSLNEGFSLEQLAQALQEHFRDLMVLRNCGADTEMVDISDANMREKSVAQARNFDDATLVYFITVLEELYRTMKLGISGRPLLEAAIVRLTATERFSDTKLLLENLQKLPADSDPAPARRTRTSSPTRQDIRRSGEVHSDKPYEAAQKPTTVAQKNAVSQPHPLTPPETLNLVYFQEHWSEITEQTGRQELAEYFKATKPVRWENGVLTLQFKHEKHGLYSLLQDRADLQESIKKALSDVCRQPLETRFEIAAKQSQQQVPPAPSEGLFGGAVPAGKSPGAKPSQQEVNAVMNEPQIQNVQQILGGKVRRIERSQNNPGQG